MKILMCSHHFLPRHGAGTEVHTWRVAGALRDRGHDVTVAATDDTGGRGLGDLKRETWDGLSVWSLGHPRVAPSPYATLDDPRMLTAFDEVLDAVNPDVVHFQHLMYLGLGSLERACARGFPTVLTLHEYWLLCARGGQMLRESGLVCDRVDRDTCARCLLDFRFGRTAWEARVSTGCERVRRLTGFDPFPALKGLRQKFRRPSREPAGGREEKALRGLQDFLQERERRVSAVLDAADVVLCPSRFLRNQFLRHGAPAQKLRYWPNGCPPTEVISKSAAEPPPGLLRATFLGSLVPSKGAHVLLQAARELAGTGLRVQVVGSLRADPAYSRRLRDLAVPEVTRFVGPVAQERLPEVWRSTDVLVVPSVWFENAPLVISEAFSAGVPVVVSAHGGLTEWITPEVDGLHFAVGSPADLARALRRLMDEPGLLPRLRQGVRAPRSLEDEGRSLEALYGELVRNRSGGRGPGSA